MIRVAIVGGGPGGLFTASMREEKYANEYQTTVFEACHRIGGKIVTNQFESAPVSYEAGVAELYNYAACGPDPLLRMVNRLGLKTIPMNGQTVVLNERILRNQADVRRICGSATYLAIRDFRAGCREAMSPEAWYEGNSHYDNTHQWARYSCEAILDKVPDEQARKYLRIAAHSDLAAEPYQSNGINGLKNFLMDVPGYIRLYSVAGGIEQIPQTLLARLRQTRVQVDCRVTSIEKTSHELYRVAYRRRGEICREDFDVVFVALPHNWLGAIEWRGDALRKAMTRFIAYYDHPGHYLRVSLLFQRPFWRDRIAGSWFILDAFGGCCVYDEGTRYDAGEFGVLSWLIAGTDALSMSATCDALLARTVMATLPGPLRDEATSLFMEAKVNRWPAAVSAQPGGLPVRDTRSDHLPEPRDFPGLFMVGDYLFDSTLNGVLDSADFATDLLNSWILKRTLIGAAKTSQKISSCPPSAPDERYLRDLVGIAWKAKPPYRLLNAGSGGSLLLGEFADDHFDFVYEARLPYLPEKQLPAAIRELYRVSRRGVIFAGITTDMNPEVLKRAGVLDGMKSLMTLWEWGELFAAAGFSVAVNDDKRLDRLWRCERKYNKEGPDWYPDPESIRYCFYSKNPDPCVKPGGR